MAISSDFGGPFGSWLLSVVVAVPGRGAFTIGQSVPLCPECCADAQSIAVSGGFRTFLVGTSCGAFYQSVYGSRSAGEGLPGGVAVTAIAPDASLVGTSGAGVFHVGGGFTPASDGLPPGASVKKLVPGARGMYAALTAGGLFQQAGAWKDASAGLPPGSVVDAIVAASPDLAAVAADGLYARRSDGAWVRSPASANGIRDLHLVAGRLFAAAGTAGVLRKVNGVWQRESSGLPSGAEARVLDGAMTGGGMALIGESAFVGTAGDGVQSAFARSGFRTMPSVVDAVGAGGTRYRTELVIGNLGNRSPLLMALAGDVLGRRASVDVPPNTEFRTPDAAGWLRSAGMAFPADPPAATLTTGFAYPYQNWSPDPVYMIARVYSADGSGGTYGVTLGSVTDLDAAEEEATVYGLRSEPGVDRSNLAVVQVPAYGHSGYGPRPGPMSATLTVQVFSSDGIPAPVVLTKALSQGEWFQWNDVLRLAGLPERSSGWARITRASGFGTWTGYGVVNDVRTSDGAVLPLFRSGGAAGLRRLLVPVVLDAAGEAGSRYTTELTLANDTAKPSAVELSFQAAPDFGGGPGTAPVRVSLAAHEQRTMPDAIAFLRQVGIAVPVNGNGDAVGTLNVVFGWLEDGLDENTAVLARTTTPNPDRAIGGRFGTAYAAIPWGTGARASALVPALSQDGKSRSNLAVVNAGGGGGAEPLVLSVQLRDAATGSETGSALTVTLAPGEWHQWSRVADRAGTASTAFTALVKKLSGDDTFYAYGVVNDARTSDGSFVEMIRLDPN